MRQRPKGLGLALLLTLLAALHVATSGEAVSPSRQCRKACRDEIAACVAATSFDTVLYLRTGTCASGPEVAAGCNDDACPNASGASIASRITPTVTAGQTYFIVVDGYGGTQGSFSLTVTPPGASTTTTTTTPPPTTTTATTTTLPGGGACTSPTVIPAQGGT